MRSASIRLYESEDFIVLQYYLKNRDGDDEIRDYVVAPTPLVGAGLWTPYDHTSRTTRDMKYLRGNGYENGMGLWRNTYAIGPVTSMDRTRQKHLGLAYGRAVTAARACTSLAAAAR